jgi:hypothetical protein
MPATLQAARDCRRLGDQLRWLLTSHEARPLTAKRILELRVENGPRSCRPARGSCASSWSAGGSAGARRIMRMRAVTCQVREIHGLDPAQSI